jgi:hypothetical protein
MYSLKEMNSSGCPASELQLWALWVKNRKLKVMPQIQAAFCPLGLVLQVCSFGMMSEH